MSTQVLTKEMVYQRLYENGETLKDWANKNDYTYQQVLDVTTGRNKATRGLGREIAIKLGMKAKPVEQSNA